MHISDIQYLPRAFFFCPRMCSCSPLMCTPVYWHAFYMNVISYSTFYLNVLGKCHRVRFHHDVHPLKANTFSEKDTSRNNSYIVTSADLRLIESILIFFLDAEKVESPLTVCGFTNPLFSLKNPTTLVYGRALDLSIRRPDIISKTGSVYPKPTTS